MGNIISITPAIYLLGLAVGVLGDVVWPMECASLMLLVGLLIAWGTGFKDWLGPSALGNRSAFFLASWLGWSALGATWVSPVPAVAWWSLAHDVLGVGVFIAAIYHTRKMGDQRWRDPLRATAILIIGVVAASWFAGDLLSRGQNVWGGMNANLLANLFIPLLILPLMVPSVRAKLGTCDRWLLLCALVAGLLFCWLSGRRLAFMTVVLASGGALMFQISRPGLRLALGLGLVGMVGMVAAVATGLTSGAENGDALRPLVYRAAWGEFIARPLVGIGPAGGYAMQEGISEPAHMLTASGVFVTHAHSTVMEVLVSGGGIGFLLLVGAVFGFCGTVTPARRLEVGCVAGAVLPGILFDASPGSLLGHVWLPFVLGCAWATSEVPAKPECKAARVMGGVCLLLMLVATTWLLTQSLVVACLRKGSVTPAYAGAIQCVRNPDLVSQFLVFIQRSPEDAGHAQALREALLAAHHYCGWFMHWPDLAWSMRQVPPTREDMDALAAVLRRSPFQDAPYGDLATIDPTRLSPALRVRSEQIARINVASPGLEGALGVWRQTVGLAFAGPLSETDRNRFLVILQRYPEVPGIAGVGLWLYARGALNDPAIFIPLRMRLRLACIDMSFIAGMIESLAPDQQARLARLNQDLQLGLPLDPPAL